MKQLSSKDLAVCVAALVSLGIVGCGSDDNSNKGSEETPATTTTPTTTTPHWTYEGLEGPTHWGELDAQFATCGTGEEQSPIDIPAAVAPGALSALSFQYGATPATILDNGHTVQVSMTGSDNKLSIDGEQYSLLQFHFHAHSEHAVNGEYKPLEMHLVHKSDAGALAVVGVFFDVGAENAALSSVFDTMGSATSDPAALASDVNPSELLPEAKDGWTYAGSLTTPPCTEGVKWHVLSHSLELSAEQLEDFTAKHELSYRPVMTNSSVVTSGD
jgi:carbonic anhydrase